MTSNLVVSQMQANVALSRGHIAKQEAIIIRLALQGHEALEADARTLLITMNDHLDTEVRMLADMKLRLVQGQSSGESAQ